jgi:hypothetical protein
LIHWYKGRGSNTSSNLGAVVCFLTKAFKGAHVGTRKVLNNEGEEAEYKHYWIKYRFLVPSSLSDLGEIYCGSGKLVHFPDLYR